MSRLKGFQKKYLRGLAHNLNPVILIGQKGLTDELVKSSDQALERHELIKVKFNEFKEKDQKAEITEELCKRTNAELAGTIGHIAILYREQTDPDKKNIVLPE
ncbi:MAG: ribosome assembly RNA-binding protein YhbY [Deltaproteobacteria bacterium]|nr:ribosome assembly RNA-binding protein YhbY [Deltaproteobacteria bacterium]